ncbi:MAG TPA: DUF4403 family protein [Saprospiraceae bacterium]|nr:DUF4403 family protein [Saprospiraceae bacterium]
MKQYFILILIGCIACSKKNFPNPIPISQDMPIPPLPSSQAQVPISINKNELHIMLKEQLNEAMKNGFLIDGKYLCQIEMTNLPSVSGHDNQLNLELPLHVALSLPSTGENIQAEGQLKLKTSTSLEIFEKKLLSNTQITEHQWVNAPVLKVMGLPIPIQGIANSILNWTKSSICKQLDQQLQTQFNFIQLEQRLQSYFSSPVWSTEDSIIHIFIGAQEMAVGNLFTTSEELIIPVIFYFESIISEQRSTDLNQEISFTTRPLAEDISTIKIQSRIPLNYIEQLVREATYQQSFGNSLFKFEISKIRLTGMDKELTILLDVKGGFEGKLKLSCQPEFDSNKKQILLNQFKMEITEGKKMEKGLYSIFEGLINGRVKSTLEDQINNMKKDMMDTLQIKFKNYEVKPGILYKAELLDHNIQHFSIVKDRMYFNLGLKLKSKLEVYQLSSIKN